MENEQKTGIPEKHFHYLVIYWFLSKNRANGISTQLIIRTEPLNKYCQLVELTTFIRQQNEHVNVVIIDWKPLECDCAELQAAQKAAEEAQKPGIILPPEHTIETDYPEKTA